MSNIAAISSINSDLVKNTALSGTVSNTDNNNFGTFLQSAVDLINETNQLQQDYNAEKLNVALGYSDNTHDLTIAQSKASTAMQYTIAVRDRFIEAYKEIMNIQI
ncbi:flagellar hook-basal body complex protein FliE [Konateibacter massiliensis]|uniref:flagellar hook-basal body complex protein FliE n=1 Tax=Konateibacter massiliensis TaxID=2002841 RepID=UPI000C14FD23|nr:flagellar hook-basal body complex protein FliE [Konateibacter massiliensis]